MRLEKFLDPFAVFRKLILQSKKHFNQAQGEHAFGINGRFTATELGGLCEEFHSSWTAFVTPKLAAMQELFPLTLACLLQKLGCWEAL
jgi:hypothetical protein